MFGAHVARAGTVRITAVVAGGPRSGNRTAWWLVGGWILAAGVTVGLVAFLGTDIASAILFAAALVAVAGALVCVGRAVDARGVAGELVWIGRALGLLGAAWAVAFPAELYQEIRMLMSRGDTPAAWFPPAISYEFAVMPLVVVPALIALRWRRLGGVLFLIDGIFNILESVYRPFGVIFPEATSSGWIGVEPLDLILQPAFVTAVLLLIGSSAARERSARLIGGKLA